MRATEADDGDPLTRELTGSLAVTVRITDVNEPPVITGNQTPSVAENTTAVGTYRAADPEGVTVTLSLQAGADLFTISSAGVLAFKNTNPPNYEALTVHTAILHASDGTNPTDHPVTVTVTDVDEREMLKLSARRPLIGDDYTTAFEEGTGDVVQSPTWAWGRSTSRTGGFSPISGETAATYVPVTGDSGYYLRVTASYNDGHSDRTLQATSELATSATSLTNVPPAFPDPLFTGGATGLSVRENATARTVVGLAPQATDPESEPLSYSLAVSNFDTDPPFEIHATSRQIRVAPGAALDHEGPDATYSVTVTAEDDFNATGTATFDITIEDVNERPVAVPDPLVRTDEDTRVTFDVLANDTDPEPDTLTVRSTTQPRRGRVVVESGTQMLTYTPVEDDHGTYTFTYTASDGTFTSSPALVTVTVDAVNDLPVFSSTFRVTLFVSESAVGGDIVGAVTATDVEGDPLTYSLFGRRTGSFCVRHRQQRPDHGGRYGHLRHRHAGHVRGHG